MARRLVERALRFVEAREADENAHSDLEIDHTQNCQSADKPVSGLLADLRTRGMVKDRLVVWGGQFGRTPFFQGSNDDRAGRDHNPWGFTMSYGGRQCQRRPDNRINRRTGVPCRERAAAANKKLKVFYIYCGDADTLYESNKSFHALLDQKKIVHMFVETKEGHVWRNWRDYLIEFAPRLFR